MRVSPEGNPPGTWITGRALNADGNPVVNAPVDYTVAPCGGGLPITIASKKTDGDGNYRFEYVRRADDDCGGSYGLQVIHPQTRSVKWLGTPINYNGQHTILDAVFLARGNVQGTIFKNNGAPAERALVQVTPFLEPSAAQTVLADVQGRYQVRDIPVGNVSVKAFHSNLAGNERTTGLAAGSIAGPNETAIVNVSLQNITGVISGRVVNANQSTAARTLIVASAAIPGFGAGPVGYAFSNADGTFRISGLPIGQISLSANSILSQTSPVQTVQLTGNAPTVNNVLIVLNGNGSVRGKVLNDVGAPVANATVRGGSGAVRTDANGDYLIQGIQEGEVTVNASDPVTGQSGSVAVRVQAGQETANAVIYIYRPATVTGQVFKKQNGVSVPAVGIIVSSDGINRATTNATGNYTLTNVQSRSEILLRFVDVARRLSINIGTIVAPGETLIRNATFDPAKIHGRITQPDGVTPTLAQVRINVPVVDLTDGPSFGTFRNDLPAYLQTGADGNYSLETLNPGAYSVSTSNAFFPVTVRKSGQLAPGADLECNLSLVDTLAGKIKGTVYQPDGVTLVGAGVKVTLGSGTLGDAMVPTDENGYFEFGEVFSAGSYPLTATDPVTGFTNRISISVKKNEDSVSAIRLKGRGTLRVKVIDGAGQPATSGSVTLDGVEYPNNHRYQDITFNNTGIFEFEDLFEGNYAISAEQLGLGGRVQATVVRDAGVEAIIQLAPSGAVAGRVLMPDGNTAVGLADVTLRSNGRTLGILTTSDAEENRGAFAFTNVPVGEFTVEAFDNRTGRTGVSAGRVTAQGQTAQVTINLTAVGAVAGRVTANGNPVDHALVKIEASSSGIRNVSLEATTDVDGQYRFAGIPAGRFTVIARDVSNGRGGTASGIVAGTNEPLPDTIANIVLEPTVTLQGTVYQLGGTEPVAGARVKAIINNSRVMTVATDTTGKFVFNLVPLGTIILRAEAPSGYDRGESAPIVASNPGETITSNVTFAGVGTIAGAATDNVGNPLNVGSVVFTNNQFGTNLNFTTPVQNGRYEVRNVPAGNFSLKLSVPNRSGTGVGTGVVVANQTANLDLQLESAGNITGLVKSENGSVPVVGADVRLNLVRSGANQGQNFYTHTDSQGRLLFENLPLGTANIQIVDPNTGGAANVTNLTLNTNAQIIDFGEVRLDSTPISVLAINPANSATQVATNTTVAITFSEPVLAASVNSNSVSLRQNGLNVAVALNISTDGTVVTLTPSNRLADNSRFEVTVSETVKDRIGNQMLSAFASSFTTRDETAPTVASISPASGSIEVSLNSSIVITANEELDRQQNLASVIQVTNGQTTVVGNVSLNQTGRIVTFVPNGALAESANYTVTVNGLRDLADLVQTQAFTANFVTVDRTPPTIDSLPINGTSVRTFRPRITATYRDNASGIKTNTVVLTLDGATVTSGVIVTGGSLSYTPTVNLARGSHTVTVQVADNAGNVSAVKTASFTIDDSGPVISSFTIGGVPAVNGAQVSTSLRPIFEINYTDNSGINTAATKLYLRTPRTSPVDVITTVTNNRLTSQSPVPLAEGVYLVRAVITNNIGLTTDTGLINFTLDVDAPEIQTVAPNTGNQHGGTTVVLSGLRLLNSNNTAPTVTFGNNPATVISAAAGVNGAPDTVTISTPPGVPGATTIDLTTDRGNGRKSNGFTYQADPKTPFAVEPDTLLLWHLDEPASGNYLPVQDSGDLGLHGTAVSTTTAQPGRFGGGRSGNGNPLTVQNPYTALNFGNTSFTMEGWFKAEQSSSARTLLQVYNNGYGGVATVNLEASGAITATLRANGGSTWTATMPTTVYDVDNNQWHHIALVTDREQNKLILYVDGVERASAVKPSTFDLLLGSGTGYSNTFYSYLYPDMVTDELRVLNFARSVAQVRETWFGAATFSLNLIAPSSSVAINQNGLIPTQELKQQVSKASVKQPIRFPLRQKPVADFKTVRR